MAKQGIRLWFRHRLSDHIRDETKQLVKYDVGIGLFAGLVGAIIEAMVFWDETKSWIQNLEPTLLTAVVVFMLTSNLMFIFYRRKRELHEIVQLIDSRTQRVVQYFALGTSNGHFDATIRRLTDADMGRVTWLVAKFIAEKLDRVFRDEGGITIESMDLQEFSEFQADIVRECESSIYLTCPFTPTAWFDFLIDPPRRLTHKSGLKLEKSEWNRYFKHLVSFGLSAIEKKRVVVLDEDEWEELLRNEYDFEEFCRTGRGDRVPLRFVREKDLSFRHKYDLAKKDYGIYDRNVVLLWEPSANGPKIGSLKMTFDVDKYLEIFANTDQPPFLTEAEVRKQIKELKQRGQTNELRGF